MVGGDGQLLVIVYKNNNQAVLLHHFKYRNKYKIYKMHCIGCLKTHIQRMEGEFCARYLVVIYLLFIKSNKFCPWL